MDLTAGKHASVKLHRGKEKAMPTLEEMYESIPIGKRNAVTKERLAEMWGYKTERHVREVIAKLRAMDNGDNYVILSSSHNKGFYRTDNVDEILAFKKETTNRARHTFRPLRKANRILKDMDSMQLEIVPPNRLREAREATGLLQKDVIPIIKQHDPSFNKVIMSMIENNKALPTAQQLAVMSRLYNQSTADLIGMEIMSS